MKFWIAQDDCGMVHLFTIKPKKYEPIGKNTWNRTNGCWYIEGRKGNIVWLNNDMESERYKADDGTVQTRYLADIIGLKRKPSKDGIIRWEGVSMKEAREIEINFELKIK